MKKKKFIYAVIGSILILSLLACGDKKVDYGINGGSDDAADAGGISGQLDVPDSCDVTFDTGESKLSSITLKDDDIEVPDADRVYKVGFDAVKTPCSDADLKTIISKLFDETSEVRWQSDDAAESREILDNGIEMYKSEIEKALANGDPGYAELLEVELVKYEEERKNMSDELPLATEYKLNEHYVAEKDGIQRIFMAASDAEDGGGYNNYYFTYGMTPEGEDKALVSEVPGTESTYEINVVGEDTYDGDEKNPITEDEGLSSAMKLLDNLGISGFACTGTEEAVRAWTGGTYGEDVIKKPDGYRFQFGRKIDGIDVVYSTDIDTVDSIDTDNLTYKGGVDKAVISVDKFGVVSSTVYVYADEDTFDKEEVKLLSWDEMIKAAGESIAKYYKNHPTNYGTVEFNDVELAYVPCADESGNKYFVPTWIFSQNEYNEDYRCDMPLQRVYINAVDGSYIDIVDNIKKIGMYDEIKGK